MKKDFDILLHRRKELEKNLEEIRKAVSGRPSSFRLYVEEDGEFSVKKAEKLINDMIKTYQEYLDNDEKFAPESDKTVVTKGKLKKLLHHFLYLSIMGPKLSFDYSTKTQFPYYIYDSVNESFEDILEFARTMSQYRSAADLYLSEQYFMKEESYYSAGNYIDFLNALYYRSSGKKILDTYDLPSEKWDENNWIGLRDEVAEEETDEEVTVIPTSVKKTDDGTVVSIAKEDMERVQGYEIVDGDEIDLPAPDPEYYEEQERLLFEELEDIDRDEKESFERWAERVGDPKTFSDKYIEFRKLFFDKDLMKFTRNWEENTRNMIDAFLYKEDLSLYSLGEDYRFVSKRIQMTAEKMDEVREKIRRQ